MVFESSSMWYVCNELNGNALHCHCHCHFISTLFVLLQISVLPILATDGHDLNDDDECAARQMVRHVCVALKRYMESHLFYKYTQLSRLNEPSASAANAVPLFRVSETQIS